MKVCEIASKKVVCVEANENVAKVLEKMEKFKIHQVPVVENGKFIGMIFLKRILKAGFFPEKSVAKNFVERVPTLNLNESLEKAAEKIVGSGARALPIVEQGKLVGIITETDLIKHLEVLEEILPQEIEKEVITAKIGDKIGKIRSLMENHNISRIPIINEEGKIVGCVDNLQLIKIAKIPKESLSYAKIAKEKTSLKNLPVKDFVRESCLMDINEFSLKKVVKKLQKFDEVILVQNDSPFSIITPKDILKLALPKIRKVFVSHLHELEVFENYKLAQILQKFVEKFDRIIDIEHLKVDLKIYSKLGKKKYSLRASLKTKNRIFSAKTYGWKIADAAHELVKKLEINILKFRKK